MRIVAILASFNEEVFVRACFENYFAQGVEVYLIDNSSTDATVEIARQYLGRGLVGIESFPRHGSYVWEPILRRKEEVAEELGADWYLHADMDEIRRPPPGFRTIADALREAERAGANQVNFKNYLFLPTKEAPDHEHPDFERTMLWYRYMEPSYPNQVKGWKNQGRATLSQRLRRLFGRDEATPPKPVDLVATGGHLAAVANPTLWPVDFIMKHYQVLSIDHAIRKYVEKTYSPEELARGWHGWKGTVRPANLRLPSESEMRRYKSDEALDSSDPIKRTLLYEPEPGA